MNDGEPMPAQSLSIAAVERSTGLSKDTLRVWERRYGFPRPLRDSAGDRLYPPDQVERLRTIRRLLDAGHRPGRIVALAPQALQALSAPAAVTPSAQQESTRASRLDACMDLIGRHDIQELRRELGQSASRLGLVEFVTAVMAPLNTAVGDAWASGRFQVFEEHLYTECVISVLRNAMANVPEPQETSRPRIVLTTIAGEPHGLGLLMAEALLALEGCHCLALGPQTPMADIVQAAQVHHADIVALSFTAMLGANTVVSALRELRRQLPQPIALWVGGECPALYRRDIPGVLPVQALESLPGQVAYWHGRVR